MENCTMPEHGSPAATAACCRPDATAAIAIASPAENFWGDTDVWRRAGSNTFNCLVGCSIGDFGMMFYLGVYHPEMSVALVMALAMASGLATSVALETVILRWRESFAWKEALTMALSMSFISMLGMELAASATDYALTGGAVEPSTSWFWIALGISLVVGFLAPLPYNYYMLKKHGNACH